MRPLIVPHMRKAVLAEALRDTRVLGAQSRAVPAFGGQSMTAPPVQLISLAVSVRAQSDAANVAMLATSS